MEDLDKSDKITAAALNIFEHYKENEELVTSVEGVKAASLYLASLYQNEKMTQKEAGEVFGVSQTTVSKAVENLKTDGEMSKEIWGLAIV